jgi:uncharacterized protein (DUF1684 family)
MRARRQRLAWLAHWRQTALVCLVVAAAASSLGCSPGASRGVAWNDEVVKEIEAWREKHEADYRRDWATIEGLYFLAPGTHTAGSGARNDIVLLPAFPERIGRFTLEHDVVTFDPELFVGVTINDRTPSAAVTLSDDDSDPTDEIEANGLSIVVHRTGERVALRVRNPNGERAKAFRGFSWFPISRDYRVLGRFIRDSVPHDEHVVNTFGDIDTYTSEGIVEFTLKNQILRLRPFTTRPKHLYIVFKDATSGEETYEAARFLSTDLRDDGTVIIDFNEAYNPPCAFNPFTTCPIPLRQNWLRTKILAGEKKYAGDIGLPGPAAR